MINKKSLKHIISLAISLSVIWLLLSGHYTPLLIGLGGLSVLVVVTIAYRMRLFDITDTPVFPYAITMLPYWHWLLKEIILSTINVCWQVLQPTVKVKPTMVTIQALQQSDFGRVVYANSITLTPGTVSIALEHDMIQVHALTDHAVAGLTGNEMNTRIASFNI